MDRYSLTIFVIFVAYAVWVYLVKLKVRVDELNNRLDKITSESENGIGSRSIRVTISPRWGQIWNLIASADGKASGDEVIKIIRHYQDSGFKPDSNYCFKGGFYRKVFEDLKSGLQLHFNDQGRLVNADSVSQGWAVYDNAKDCPVELSDAPFVSAFFSLGWSTFEIDQMMVDKDSIAQQPEPVRNYLYSVHGESLFQFVKALTLLESKGYSSQRPFLAIPDKLADQFESQGIRYVMDKGWSREDDPVLGFEFGICNDRWHCHQLQSDYLDFYIDVERFNPRYSFQDED